MEWRFGCIQELTCVEWFHYGNAYAFFFAAAVEILTFIVAADRIISMAEVIHWINGRKHIGNADHSEVFASQYNQFFFIRQNRHDLPWKEEGSY